MKGRIVSATRVGDGGGGGFNIAKLCSLSISSHSSPFRERQRKWLETCGMVSHLCDTKNTRPHWQRSHQAVAIGTAPTNRRAGCLRPNCHTHSDANQWKNFSHGLRHQWDMNHVLQINLLNTLMFYPHLCQPDWNSRPLTLSNELPSMTSNPFLTFPLRKCKEFQLSMEGVDRRARRSHLYRGGRS